MRLGLGRWGGSTRSLDAGCRKLPVSARAVNTEVLAAAPRVTLLGTGTTAQGQNDKSHAATSLLFPRSFLLATPHAPLRSFG